MLQVIRVVFLLGVVSTSIMINTCRFDKECEESRSIFHIPPGFAGLMTAFSSVCIVTSSLLLRAYVKPIIDDDGTTDEQGCIPFFCKWFQHQKASVCDRAPRGGWESVVV